MDDTPVLEELAEWHRWANALVGQKNSDEEQRAAIARRFTPNFTPIDPGTWIRDVDGSWRRAPSDPRYAPERLPAAPRWPSAGEALPIGQAFAAAVRWRIYFNRHGAADRPWCIAPEAGGWELAVASVGISTVAETVYQPKAVPDDEDGHPSAWIAIDGYLTVHDSGHASIGSDP